MLLLRQVFSTLGMSLAADLRRPRHLLLVASGFFIACMSLVGLLSIPAGLDRMAGRTGLDDVALILSATAQDESSSRLTPGIVGIASSLPGIAHAADGRARVAPQFVTTIKLRRPDGGMESVLARGVDDATWDLLGSGVQILSGRRFKSGVNEMLVGADLGRRYVELDLGAPIKVRSSPWQVSGEFRAGDSLWNSELWGDLGALRSSFNVAGGASVLWVKLASSDAYDTLAEAMHADPRLNGARVVPQRMYYERKLGFLVRFSRIAALGIAAVLGLGATLAIANALAMALAARRREMAMLRAVGFRGTCIGIATLLEIMLIGAVSAAVAVAAAWLLLDGMAIGTATTSQAVVFTFGVTRGVMLWALAYAVLLGLLSALWPAFRATRAPLVSALRMD